MKKEIRAWLENHNWRKACNDVYKKGNRTVVLYATNIQLNGTEGCIFYEDAELASYGIVSRYSAVSKIILA